MEARTKFTVMDANWKTEEQTMKGIAGKETLLTNEKKLLFTKLAEKVKEEYKTGKMLKIQRDAYDAGLKSRKINEARLLVKQGREAVLKREHKDADDGIAALEGSKQEQAAISDKESGHIQTKIDELGDVTRADQLNAAVNGQDKDLAKEKEAQLNILQDQKLSAGQEKSKVQGELETKIAQKQKFQEHVKTQEGKINEGSLELTSWLANEKTEKSTQLSNMNEKKNTM